MLINPSTPVNYPDLVAFVKTKKRINQSSLEWDLWLEGKQVPGVLKQLQADHIIGPAYAQKDPTTPGHTLYYDVLANNKKPQSSPWWHLWGYKLETGILFTHFLWLSLKNRMTGKKHPLDVVADATKTAAQALKVDYRLGIDYQLDGSKHYMVEFREDIDDKQVEELASRLRTEPTLKSFEISRSKNLLKFCPTI